METIEEAIEDIKKHLIGLCEAPNYEEDNYAAGYITAIDEKTSEIFKAGVEFAQQWHSIKIELPEWYTGCRLDILVKKETFNYPPSVIVHHIYSDKDIQELKDMYTHWRPIELK